MQHLTKELVKLKLVDPLRRYNTFGANLKWVSAYSRNTRSNFRFIKLRELIKQGVSISENYVLSAAYDIDGEPVVAFPKNNLVYMMK